MALTQIQTLFSHIKLSECIWIYVSKKFNIFFCSLACSIELEEMVVVTGGCCAITRVMAYNNDGPMYRLPDMPTAREKHACSHYVDSNNNLVSHVNLYIEKNNIFYIIFVSIGIFGDRWLYRVPKLSIP